MSPENNFNTSTMSHEFTDVQCDSQTLSYGGNSVCSSACPSFWVACLHVISCFSPFKQHCNTRVHNTWFWSVISLFSVYKHSFSTICVSLLFVMYMWRYISPHVYLVSSWKQREAGSWLPSSTAGLLVRPLKKEGCIVTTTYTYIHTFPFLLGLVKQTQRESTCSEVACCRMTTVLL